MVQGTLKTGSDYSQSCGQREGEKAVLESQWGLGPWGRAARGRWDSGGTSLFQKHSAKSKEHETSAPICLLQMRREVRGVSGGVCRGDGEQDAGTWSF